MSSIDKLIIKFLSRKNITVDDCDRLLISYGYDYHKSGGNHRVYHQKGTKAITVVMPKKSKYVNTAYVDLIIKGLNLEGLYGNK
jgi:predicted RNA binding protein YcfA (HicA-like mRNA interferase family)